MIHSIHQNKVMYVYCNCNRNKQTYTFALRVYCQHLTERTHPVEYQCPNLIAFKSLKFMPIYNLAITNGLDFNITMVDVSLL